MGLGFAAIGDIFGGPITRNMLFGVYVGVPLFGESTRYCSPYVSDPGKVLVMLKA